jgi:2-dehydro-3-deoxyphosphogluconate aldolase/(4S)-4-hydroxy-2-oxoglutarate aldolase
VKRIVEKRILPAATVDSVETGLKLAEALCAGGLDIIEVTFRTAAAADAIHAIVKRFPNMLVGAGTVLTAEQLERTIQAGARFAVAPGFNEDLVRKAKSAGVPFIPGVVTPTEVDRGVAMGVMLQKFFPASVMGGAKMLKALAGPFGHTGVKFIPTGGIDATNAAEYLALPVVAAVGGSWMVASDLVKAGKWDEITRLSREAIALGAAKG